MGMNFNKFSRPLTPEHPTHVYWNPDPFELIPIELSPKPKSTKIACTDQYVRQAWSEGEMDKWFDYTIEKIIIVK